MRYFCSWVSPMTICKDKVGCNSLFVCMCVYQFILKCLAVGKGIMPFKKGWGGRGHELVISIFAIGMTVYKKIISLCYQIIKYVA